MYFWRHGVDPSGYLDQSFRPLEDVMMLYDQNRFAKEHVESDIVALAMPDRPAKEQREASVSQYGRLGEFTDCEPNWFLDGVRNCVHRSVEIVRFQDFHCFYGKTALRENHHAVTRKTSPFVVGMHPLLRDIEHRIQESHVG